MAPTTTLIKFFVRIPSKVIALLCEIIAMVLMIIALFSSYWLTTEGWRQGLFTHCIEENASTPLPFNVIEPADCHPAINNGYIYAAAALCVLTLLTDVAGIVLTGLGFRSCHRIKKYKYYRIAVHVMNLSQISALVALVLYPFSVVTKLNEGNRTVWELGWGYGVGWGAVMFLITAVIFLLFDEESEIIYFKERFIVNENENLTDMTAKCSVIHLEKVLI